MPLNNEDTPRIKAEMIIEVIGKPAEHLTETLEKLIKEMDEEKGVRVSKKDIKEPQVMKDQEEFFTSFAEIQVEVEDILYLVILMFKYMPAHIELITPEVIALTNNGWNDLLNELVRRLHGYDEVARILQVEKNILEKRVRELIGKNSEESVNKDSKSKKSKS